ncbi:Ig-like domain-containing protein [Chloroflexota bacterium]
MKKKIFGILTLVLIFSLSIPAAALAVIDPVVYDISLSPDGEYNAMGTDHTVTATVVDTAGDITGPVEGVMVTFHIGAGPNYEGLASNPAYLYTATTGSDGKASWTYTGTMDSGRDTNNAWANYDTDPLWTAGEPDDFVYKYWLYDKFSGGGKIVQEIPKPAKKKDWAKITWGGWAGNYMGSDLGAFEVTFHNVSNNSLDKTKFVSYFVTMLNYDDFSQTGCPDADPPPSDANFAQVRLFGEIQDDEGGFLAYGTIIINGMDNGEPGNIDEKGANAVTSDGIRFILYSGGSPIYDSYLSGDFLADQANSCSDDGVRHELDSGNLQIVWYD